MSIASQQLSTKAADTIFRRFCDLFPPDRRPTPGRVMTLTDDEIRAVGYSRPKVSFIKDLASHVLDGRLDLKGLTKHPDDEVMRQLVAVKGIGRWTAEIFLMFRLGRPDILPADDLGLMNAVQRAYGKRKRPTPKQLRKMGEAWRPYRSVAAWYLWASLAKPSSPEPSSPSLQRSGHPDLRADFDLARRNRRRGVRCVRHRFAPSSSSAAARRRR